MPNAIALIDCNNFYASCERLFRPDLKDKPVIVLSNNDGNVVARSNEAKTIGFKMGAPVFETRHLIEANGVSVFSSNYQLYGDLSGRVMGVLREFTPDVEVYSIDEAFIGLTRLPKTNLTDIGRAIRKRVQQCLGLPVSVGISTTKTLAKVAAYHAKRSTKADGVVDLTEPRLQDVALARLPVDEVWGVGSQYAQWLKSHGIETGLDLRNAEDEWIRKRMRVTGLKTVHELRGIPCLPLELEPPPKKTLRVTRSFGGYVETLSEMRAAVAWYVTRAGEKLRRHRMAAGALSVFISTNRFANEPQYGNAISFDLAPLTDDSIELMELAQRGLETIFRDGYRYKRAGVTLDKLAPVESLARRLWSDQQHERHQALMQAVDGLNKKFGQDVVRCGLHPSAGEWQTKFQWRSPRYTTKWDELCVVK